MTVINVDVDGVLYNFVADMREHYRAEYSRRAPGVTQWDIWEDWGWTKEKFYSKLETWCLRDHLWLGVAEDQYIIPNAREAMNSLDDAGHTLRIVSHRVFDSSLLTAEAAKRTIDWLYRTGIPYHGISFTGRNKTGIAANVVIDDNPRRLGWLQENALNILMARPWNSEHWADGASRGREVSGLVPSCPPFRFAVAHSWAHAADLINQYA